MPEMTLFYVSIKGDQLDGSTIAKVLEGAMRQHASSAATSDPPPVVQASLAPASPLPSLPDVAAQPPPRSRAEALHASREEIRAGQARGHEEARVDAGAPRQVQEDVGREAGKFGQRQHWRRASRRLRSVRGHCRLARAQAPSAIAQPVQVSR